MTRNFTALWIGRVVSYLGDWMLLVALPVWVYQLTGSTAALGFMVVVETVPSLVLAPLAGVFIDRWDRRRTMIVADLARGLVVLVLLSVRSADYLFIIYVVGFLNQCLSAFFTPARQALLPNLLEKPLLLRANAVFQFSALVVQMAGPLLGGILIAALGPFPLFVMDALSFFVSAAATATVQLPKRFGIAAARSLDVRQIRNEFIQGLTVLRGNPILWTTLILWTLLTFSYGSISPLMIAYVRQALQGTAGDFGTLLGVLGIGIVTGALLTMTIGGKFSPLSIFKFGLLVFGPIILLVANATNFVIAGTAIFLTGIAMSFIGVSSTTITQQETPDGYRGRVLSVNQAVNSAAILIAAALAGLLAEPLGVRIVYDLAAAIVIVAALIAWWRLPAGQSAENPPQPAKAEQM